jgi:hypothetical protein
VLIGFPFWKIYFQNIQHPLFATDNYRIPLLAGRRLAASLTVKPFGH